MTKISIWTSTVEMTAWAGIFIFKCLGRYFKVTKSNENIDISRLTN